MQSTARVRGRSTSKTFVYMWSGARHMLQLARSSQEGQLYTCLSALVLSAFMLEAYLNHLGQLRNKEWDEIERKYPKLRKFTMFAEAAGLTVSLTDRPYSSLVQLFNFRDSMAHGKTLIEEIDAHIEIKETLAKSLPVVDWQQLATLDRTQSLFDDAVQLIRDLHLASGYKDNPFGSAGGGMYAVALPPA